MAAYKNAILRSPKNLTGQRGVKFEINYGLIPLEIAAQIKFVDSNTNTNVIEKSIMGSYYTAVERLSPRQAACITDCGRINVAFSELRVK